jgi:transposase
MSKTMTGKRYSIDFKEQIYVLSKQGQSVAKLSSEYGIPGATIYKWIKELKSINQIDSDTPLNQKDIQAMQKRIRELEMENEILKKATAIFARKS